VVLETTKTARAYLFAVRPPRHPFTETELAILKDLAPHLAQAAQIEKRLIALNNTIYRLRSRSIQIDPLTRFQFTAREYLIASAMSSGEDVKEIAHKAGLAVATVRHHQRSIYRKLGVHSRTGFMRMLQELSKH
jgi:DNA-binding NarL/FixJ family response regulator